MSKGFCAFRAKDTFPKKWYSFIRHNQPSNNKGRRRHGATIKNKFFTLITLTVFNLALSGCIGIGPCPIPGASDAICKGMGDCEGISNCEGFGTCWGDGTCEGRTICYRGALTCDGDIEYDESGKEACIGYGECTEQGTCEGTGNCTGHGICRGTGKCEGDGFCLGIGACWPQLQDEDSSLKWGTHSHNRISSINKKPNCYQSDFNGSDCTSLWQQFLKLQHK